MFSSPFISLILLALQPVLITAQTGAPSYLSPVLIKPGLEGRKCVQPAGGSSADGTGLVLADCTGAASQEFFFESSRVRVFSNKCLTVPGGSQANDVQIQIKTCNASDANQKWYYNYKNLNQLSWATHRGICVDLTGGSTANGAKVSTRSCATGNANQVWNTGYLPDQQPNKSQNGQFGNNNCGGGSSQTSKCQTMWINSIDDFCVWGPPNANSEVGNAEREVVSWCTKKGRGTRVIPNGTLKGIHFVRTPHYVQITGVGDFTKINIKAKDSGGELDPHGPDGNGNPVGGLVYVDSKQSHEWTSFISSGEYCFRACVGPNASKLCAHRYDVMGCYWNMPANYNTGVFESCDGDDALPMGIYGTSTFHQGDAVTPPPHPAPSSSNCQRVNTISSGTTTAGGSATTTTSSPPNTTPTTPPSSGHAIHPQASSSKCLTAASNVKGAKVTIQDCNGSAGQQFVRSGKTFKVFGNLCLDVSSGTNANGTKLQVWTCTSGSTNVNQSWDVNSLKEIVWTGKNKCLDLTEGKTTNGNPLQIWACSSTGKNQIWTVV